MKSPYKNIKIAYWTLPDGTDFKGIEHFVDEVDSDYFLTVSKKRTDTLGGGLYEFIIEISEDLSVIELAKGYIEDGIKCYVGYHAKTIYNSLKTLFAKNQDLIPRVERISIKFKDCKIIFYEVYENGIEENFEEVMKYLFKFASANEKKIKKIKEIHIPIFKYRDCYDLCDYRVKLNLDENIKHFTNKDYKTFWGVKFKNKKRIYDLKNKKLIKDKFYTQKEYDKLKE